MNTLMAWLIILRGVTGIGKSTTADRLVERLGKNGTSCLNMDEIRQIEIEKNIERALKFEYVIAHIYSGQQNTEDPGNWISRFKDGGYRTLSIRLDISLEAGRKRCLQRDPGRTDYDRLYHRFYHCPKFTEFPKKAEIEEVPINVENKDTETICNDILKAINHLQ